LDLDRAAALAFDRMIEPVSAVVERDGDRAAGACGETGVSAPLFIRKSPLGVILMLSAAPPVMILPVPVMCSVSFRVKVPLTLRVVLTTHSAPAGLPDSAAQSSASALFANNANPAATRTERIELMRFILRLLQAVKVAHQQRAWAPSPEPHPVTFVIPSFSNSLFASLTGDERRAALRCRRDADSVRLVAAAFHGRLDGRHSAPTLLAASVALVAGEVGVVALLLKPSP
jgi:hypothetical protein